MRRKSVALLTQCRFVVRGLKFAFSVGVVEAFCRSLNHRITGVIYYSAAHQLQPPIGDVARAPLPGEMPRTTATGQIIAPIY